MTYNIKRNIWIGLSLFFCVNTLYGQDKYQSLLWEVKHPDVKESSYLYGTMHVSSKLAFHLTDDFFDHLTGVDIVALESDPTQWLAQNEELDKQPYLQESRFYRQFEDKVLDKYSLAEQLATDHTMINSLLYRSNSALQDFQEDTYLDMFIFQTGSRFNKTIVGLEDFKESRDLVMKAYSQEMVKENPPIWLQDLLKEKSYELILRDSYRSNNLDMIDSLNMGFSTEHYLEHMLFKRNSNMVEVYDSIVQTGKTIFAGVGAAHLPGVKGMIEMFRAKGYEVNPVFGEWTDRGKQAKKRIEDKRVKRTYSPYTSSDGFITFMSPRNVHEVSFYGKTMYLAPDLTNGSYVAISRMKLNQFVNIKSTESLSFEDIDKILIEYIPGEIVSKTEISKNGIPGINILSRTKRGDYHRYAIFKTPLEFIIFKMVGKNGDVKESSDQFFNSIQFNYSNKNTTVEPRQGGFTVDVPNYYLLDNNNAYTSNTGNPYLQAFNPTNSSYYFARQLVLNDDVFLEKDEFELNRIIDVYFKSVEIDSFDIEVDQSQERLRVKGYGQLPHGEFLCLSAQLKGGHYYLLGYQGKDKTQSEAFFNSFKYKGMNYNMPFEDIVDTNLHYTVNAPRKADMVGNEMSMYGNPDRKEFKSETKRQVFNSVSKQQVFLKYHKYNDYAQYENIDSLWSAIVKYKVNKGQVVEHKHIGISGQNDPYLELVMADTATVRKLKFKYILHGGVQYKLSTVLDSIELNTDDFVNTIFNTFQPLDTLIGKSPLDRKAPMFFEHLYSGVDSLEDQILEEYDDIKFFIEDKDRLISTIETYDFKDQDLEVKKDLISAYSNLKTDDRVIYLTKWYSVFDDNADIQLHILNLLSQDGEKRSYKQIGTFLASDIPLPYKPYKISKMFSNLNEYPELEAEIIEQLMSLLSVEEYKSAVLNALSMLCEKEVIGKRFLKKYKKSLVALAKVELKRARSQQIASSSNSYSKNEYRDLNDLLRILIVFSHDEEVQSIYNKIKQSDFKNEYTRILAYQLKQKDKVSPEDILELAQNVETRAFMYQTFSELDILEHYPQEYAQIDSIAQSYLNSRYLKKDDDQLEFYKKKEIVKEEEPYTVIYYKYFTTDYQNKKKTRMVYSIYKTNDFAKPVKKKMIEGEFREDNKEQLQDEEERFKLDHHPRVVFSNGGMVMPW